MNGTRPLLQREIDGAPVLPGAGRSNRPTPCRWNHKPPRKRRAAAFSRSHLPRDPLRAGGWGLTVALVLLISDRRAALAHQGAQSPPGNWPGWNLDPLICGMVLTAATLYGLGTRALWTRLGTGRGVRRADVAAYTGGLVALVLALVSPLDALGSALFSAHMAQHLLLTVVAAPLLILGSPLLPFLWALPLPWRRRIGGGWRSAVRARRIWRALTVQPVAWTLHASVLLVWHVPVFYETAVRDAPVHIVEHAAFLGTGLLWWWSIVRSARHGRQVGGGIAALFAMSLVGSGLGTVLTFASGPWYTVYAGTATTWGLTALEDQQLAGLLMWIPAGIAYLVAALVLFAAWLERGERAQRRAEERLRHGVAGSTGEQMPPLIHEVQAGTLVRTERGGMHST